MFKVLFFRYFIVFLFSLNVLNSLQLLKTKIKWQRYWTDQTALRWQYYFKNIYVWNILKSVLDTKTILYIKHPRNVKGILCFTFYIIFSFLLVVRYNYKNCRSQRFLQKMALKTTYIKETVWNFSTLSTKPYYNERTVIKHCYCPRLVLILTNL